jgi:hypothetical protein
VTVLTKACIWGSNLGKAGRSGVLEKVSRHLLMSAVHQLVPPRSLLSMQMVCSCSF